MQYNNTSSDLQLQHTRTHSIESDQAHSYATLDAFIDDQGFPYGALSIQLDLEHLSTYGTSELYDAVFDAVNHLLKQHQGAID